MGKLPAAKIGYIKIYQKSFLSFKDITLPLSALLLQLYMWFEGVHQHRSSQVWREFFLAESIVPVVKKSHRIGPPLYTNVNILNSIKLS